MLRPNALCCEDVGVRRAMHLSGAGESGGFNSLYVSWIVEPGQVPYGSDSFAMRSKSNGKAGRYEEMNKVEGERKFKFRSITRH